MDIMDIPVKDVDVTDVDAQAVIKARMELIDKAIDTLMITMYVSLFVGLGLLVLVVTSHPLVIAGFIIAFAVNFSSAIALMILARVHSKLSKQV